MKSTLLRLAIVMLATQATLSQIMAVAGEEEHNIVYQVVVPPKDFRVDQTHPDIVLFAPRRL